MAHLQTIQNPANVTALVGEDVMFDCQLSSPPSTFIWAASLYNGGLTVIYDQSGGGVTDPTKYAVSDSKVLTVKNIGIQDGGLYYCYITNDVKGDATLAVIELPVALAEPYPLQAGGDGQLTCSVDYGCGSGCSLPQTQIPRLYIHLDDRDLMAPVSSEIITPSYHYRLTATINATATKEYNEALFECIVRTDTSDFENSTDWILNITYPVVIIAIDPPTDEVEIGDIITCYGEANPEPSFVWESQTSPGGDVIIEGAQLQTTEVMEGYNNWTCSASNFFNGTTHTVRIIHDFDVVAVGSGEIKAGGVDAWVIAICVLIPLLVIAVVGAIIFFVLHKKKEKEKHQPADFSDSAYPMSTGTQHTPLNMANSTRPQPPKTTPPNYPVYPASTQNGKTSPGSGDLGIRLFSASGINAQSGYAPVNRDPRGTQMSGQMANGRTSASSSVRSSPSLGYTSGIPGSSTDPPYSGAFV